MATTIVTKYGSDAPADTDIVRGELAVDTENGRLYTENSSGAVVELGLNPEGNVTFGDNGKAIFGAGSDLQIYHDGSNSYIEDTDTGSLFLKTNGAGVYLYSGSEALATFNLNGANNFYYDNGLTLSTTASGIDVTGSVTADGLVTNTAGTSNFIAGVNAGNSIASGGNYNVVVGDEAGTALTTGDGNVAVGFNALAQEDEHGLNVAIGNSALYAQNAGVNAYSTAVGASAGFAVTTGIQNTLLGGLTGAAIDVGGYNVAAGFGALSGDTKGNGNTAIGWCALETQNFTDGTASNNNSFNTALGYEAGHDLASGKYNTFLGGNAGNNTDDGASNTAVGYSALFANCGNENVAIGANSLLANTGNGNVALGSYASAALSSGSGNVAVGDDAMRTGVVTGNYNSAFGNSSLDALTSGTLNVAVGRLAGASINTGSTNTLIGKDSGRFITTGSSNTILGPYHGNQGGLDIRTSSNNIVLSDGDGNPRGYFHGGLSSPIWVFENPTTNQWIATFQNTTTGNPYGLDLDFTATSPNDTTSQFIRGQDSTANRFSIYSNGNIVNVNNSYGALSDEKLKENIVDSSSQWEDIKALTVRKYSMKADNLDAPNMLGVIAQEVEAAGMGGLVYESPDLDKDMNDLGTVTKQVNYSILYMKAVKALQEAMDRIETLEAKVAALES